MDKNSKKILNGITISVLGGVILANTSVIWRAIVDSLTAIGGALSSRVSIPVWLVALVRLICLIAIGFSTLILWAAKTNRPSHVNYQQDEFVDLIWRWAYWPDGTVNEDAL